LREDQVVPHSESFWVLWDIKEPTQQRFLDGRLLDRLPFRVNLERRGIGMVSNLSPLCNKDVETIQHLLITSEVGQ